mmetsp:Transcript_7044/g.21884  ORF Transcript_7044/g.21884 Transcript_7044/m.21884 type:complete len:216 (+) Transcript_7044:175-822(+)
MMPESRASWYIFWASVNCPILARACNARLNASVSASLSRRRDTASMPRTCRHCLPFSQTPVARFRRTSQCLALRRACSSSSSRACAHCSASETTAVKAPFSTLGSGRRPRNRISSSAASVRLQRSHCLRRKMVLPYVMALGSAAWRRMPRSSSLASAQPPVGPQGGMMELKEAASGRRPRAPMARRRPRASSQLPQAAQAATAALCCTASSGMPW